MKKSSKRVKARAHSSTTVLLRKTILLLFADSISASVVDYTVWSKMRQSYFKN